MKTRQTILLALIAAAALALSGCDAFFSALFSGTSQDYSYWSGPYSISGISDPYTAPYLDYYETWYSDYLSSSSDYNYYRLSVNPGTTYRIAWDDSYEGSHNYSADIKVSVYDGDFSTLLYSTDSGYDTPQSFYPTAYTVYVKVESYNYSYGTYAIGYAPASYF